MSDLGELNLTMTSMARFACGRYVVEVGIDGSIRWTKEPPYEEAMTVENLRALVVVSTAALNWLLTNPHQRETAR